MANEFVCNDIPQPMRYVSRVNWASVIAGVLIGLVTYVLLSLLGLAVGLSAMEPARMMQDGFTGLGSGGGIWMVISLLIATFVGAWISSWWGQAVSPTDGMLHGVLTWSLMLLLMLMLVGRGLGSLMNNAVSLMGAGLTSPMVAERVVAQPTTTTATTTTVKRMAPVAPIENRLSSLIYNANTRDSSYKDLNNSPVLRRQAAEQIAMGHELNATRMLSSNTGINSVQARTLVENARLETRNVARTVVTQKQPAVGNRIIGERNVARNVTDTASRVAWWGFFSTLLSLAAAAMGGALGRKGHYTNIRREGTY